MSIIVPLDMPENCGECLFKSEYIEMCIDGRKGLYKHIARCTLKPIELDDDDWKDSQWLMHNRFSWCPLKPYEE